MNCQYCRASNTADDHRCQRCGRRLEDSANSYARPAYGRGATARVLEPVAQQDVQPETITEVHENSRRTVPIQPSLFSTRVVSFQSFAPESVEPKPKSTGFRARSKPKHAPPGQDSFNFDTVISPQLQAAKTPEAIIGCDASVAVPAHRLIAAAFDLSVVIVAVALFVLIFRMAGGQLLLNLHTLPFCVCVAIVFYTLYELLWCFADTDTAGMRWAHQKLVNFDGGPPTRDQRITRVACGCLSLLAAGLGILWALVDEESLTWHDHMSNTFPTPF